MIYVVNIQDLQNRVFFFSLRNIYILKFYVAQLTVRCRPLQKHKTWHEGNTSHHRSSLLHWGAGDESSAVPHTVFRCTALIWCPEFRCSSIWRLNHFVWYWNHKSITRLGKLRYREIRFVLVISASLSWNPLRYRENSHPYRKSSFVMREISSLS